MYRALCVAMIVAVSTFARGDTLSFTTTGAGTLTIPAGYEWTHVTVQCWGGGGGGGAYAPGGGGGGGGGGAYCAETYSTPLVAGSYSYYVGAGGYSGNAETGYGLAAGGTGGDTIWNYDGAQDVFADGGTGGYFIGSVENYAAVGGTGGTVGAGTGYSGGAGGAGGATYDSYGGGGGGGSGGPSGLGGDGADATSSAGGSGGDGYGPGGDGAALNAGAGGNGSFPGGGGGGNCSNSVIGGAGANGEIIVSYTQQAVPEPSTPALLGAGTIGLLSLHRLRRRSYGRVPL